METFLYYFIYYGLPAISGAGLGSFYSVLIYRLPRGESLIKPTSRCPSCTTPLHPWNNIPILSYALQRGKCAFCGVPISARYPLLEAGTAVLVLLLARAVFPAVAGTGIIAHSGVVALLSIAVPITIIDAEYGIIPHAITLPGIVLAAVLSFFPGGVIPLNMLAGAVAGGGVIWGISKVTLLTVPAERRIDGGTVGGGDVMMLIMYGALLGPKAVLCGLGAGSVLALAFIFIFKTGQRGKPVPFGPFLAVGMVLAAVWAERFLDWYIGLF